MSEPNARQERRVECLVGRAPTTCQDWRRALDEMLLLEPGWNSYDAAAIDPRAVAKARAILELLDSWWPGWSAAPCGDGTVQIEIHRDGFDVEISVVASNAELSRPAADAPQPNNATPDPQGRP